VSNVQRLIFISLTLRLKRCVSAAFLVSLPILHNSVFETLHTDNEAVELEFTVPAAKLPAAPLASSLDVRLDINLRMSWLCLPRSEYIVLHPLASPVALKQRPSEIRAEYVVVELGSGVVIIHAVDQISLGVGKTA
jgi:hypothetical protein